MINRYIGTIAFFIVSPRSINGNSLKTNKIYYVRKLFLIFLVIYFLVWEKRSTLALLNNKLKKVNGNNTLYKSNRFKRDYNLSESRPERTG